MPKQLTLADIVCNALDKDYSLEQAATDLGALMNDRELIKRRCGPGTARLMELECIIPLQERLAALLRRLKVMFRGLRSQPITRVIEMINPVLRGWVNSLEVSPRLCRGTHRGLTYTTVGVNF